MSALRLTRKMKSLLCSTKTTMAPVRMTRKVDILGEDKNKKTVKKRNKYGL